LDAPSPLHEAQDESHLVHTPSVLAYVLGGQLAKQLPLDKKNPELHDEQLFDAPAQVLQVPKQVIHEVPLVRYPAGQLLVHSLKKPIGIKLTSFYFFGFHLC
jgi:hypothetical protein